MRMKAWFHSYWAKYGPSQVAFFGLSLALVLGLLPLIWMFNLSLMPTGASHAQPIPFWPSRPSFEQYFRLFQQQSLWLYVLNSLVVASIATLMSLCFNVATGYAFAKLRFTGKDLSYRLLISSMVIPGQLAMLPLFFMVKYLGLINSLAGVVLPFMASIFGIVMVRQFAEALPDDLLDAARVDGADEWQVFWNVVLPNLRPILTTLGIFTFLAAWNDFLWPLIIVSDDFYYTMPLALAALSSEHLAETEMIMAGAVVTILPVFIIFLAFRQSYQRGLLSGRVR